MREYKLIGKDGTPYISQTPCQLGGHKRLKIYGRLDCQSALRHIANGHYVQHRFFLQMSLMLLLLDIALVLFVCVKNKNNGKLKDNCKQIRPRFSKRNNRSE